MLCLNLMNLHFVIPRLNVGPVVNVMITTLLSIIPPEDMVKKIPKFGNLENFPILGAIFSQTRYWPLVRKVWV